MNPNKETLKTMHRAPVLTFDSLSREWLREFVEIANVFPEKSGVLLQVAIGFTNALGSQVAHTDYFSRTSPAYDPHGWLTAEDRDAKLQEFADKWAEDNFTPVKPIRGQSETEWHRTMQKVIVTAGEAFFQALDRERFYTSYSTEVITAFRQ